MAEGDTISWAALVDEIAKKLRTGGVVDPERSARFIVLQACGAEPSGWATVADRPATVRGVAAVDAMTARRSAGEPLQYVLGEWSFRHLDLFVDNRVLIPRPETEVVAGLALDELRGHRSVAPGVAPARVVDLGTGSGAIGLSLAFEHDRNDELEVWLTDVSADALAVARANIAGLGWAGSRVRVAEGSWFDALPVELRGELAVVVANPPYVATTDDLPPEVADWEPTSALISGPAGTEALEQVVAEASTWLDADGSLVVELAPWQADLIAGRAAAAFAEVVVENDLAGRERAVIARRPHTG